MKRLLLNIIAILSAKKLEAKLVEAENSFRFYYLNKKEMPEPYSEFELYKIMGFMKWNNSNEGSKFITNYNKALHRLNELGVPTNSPIELTLVWTNPGGVSFYTDRVETFNRVISKAVNKRAELLK